jgi:hypothetical protein
MIDPRGSRISAATVYDEHTIAQSTVYCAGAHTCPASLLPQRCDAPWETEMERCIEASNVDPKLECICGCNAHEGAVVKGSLYGTPLLRRVT